MKKNIREIRNNHLLLAATVLMTMASAPIAQAQKSNRKPASDTQSVESQLKLKAGDENGNEMKALATEMLVMKSEKQALVQLNKLYAKYKKTPMEPEILFRMAELYMRRARTERFFEVHKDSQQILKAAPALVQNASEKREIGKAVDIYERIQREFTSFRAMDVVLFNHAFARQQLGQDKEAEGLYWKIVTEYKDSNLVPDSHLAIGEINYERRKFQFALEHFQAVRKYPQARVYPYGLYKAAWCFYNLQDAPAAIRQLEEVIVFGRKAVQAGLDAKLDLRKEALSDITLFFGDVFPSKKAVAYLIEQSKELDAGPYIMRLSGLYEHHSRFKDVEVVLKDMIQALPKSEQVPEAHEKLVWNYEKMKQRTQAVAQLEEFNKYCSAAPVAKDAAGKASNEPPACRLKIADTSKKLAGKWHHQWRKKNPEPDYAIAAEKAYGLYLAHATDVDAEVDKVRYSYAELLFQLNKFREASEQYAKVKAPKGDTKLAHDSSYAAIFALEKAVDNKWNEADEKKFTELSTVYLKEFPKGEHAQEIEFKRGFIAYEKQRYDEAAPIFRKIGWEYKASEKVLKAQDLYLDILNIKKDYKGLKESAKLLLDRGGDPARVTTIQKVYTEAYFAEIQTFEDKGQAKEAVAAYKQFAKENRKTDLASKAWWNASQLQFKSGDHLGGAETCAQLVELFPGTPNGKDCLVQSSQTYESMGQLDQAAKVLLQLAVLDSKQADKWTEVAADFYALSGQSERSRVIYRKLSDGPTKNNMRVLEKWYQVEKDTESAAGLKEVQAKFVALNVEPHVSRLTLEAAERAYEKRNHEEAFALSRKVVGRGGIPKALHARARLVQARILDDEFKKQSTKSRVDRMAMVLALKTEKLEKAQQAYQASINYGDPATSVTALQGLASCYLHYAESVRAITLPAGLPEAELQAFKGELDNLAIPMEERGIESLNQALQAAMKFGIRDGTIAEIQTEINKRNMKTTEVPAPDIKTPDLYVPQFGWGVGT